MKFKVDENLPLEFAELLIAAGYDAVTVVAEGLQGRDDATITDLCLREERILVTLDLGFADIRAYPPENFPGFIVFRPGHQNKRLLLEILQHTIPLMDREPLERHLWIVEETRVRIRGGTK